MKRIALTALATAMIASGAQAMMVGDLDIDGNGFATKAEIAQLIPNFRASDFRAIDLNDDNRISANELQSPGVRQVISRYEASSAVVHSISEVDQNGDRFLTMDELGAVYTGLTSSEFNDIDANKDRRVSANELYAPLAQALVSRHEMAPFATVTIMSVDSDDNHFASFDELQGAFPGLSEIDFENIDLNGDNRVASKEFYDPMSQSILNRAR